MTVSELHADPRKLAEFMGWSYKDDVVTEGYGYSPYKLQEERARTAEQATEERYNNLIDHNQRQDRLKMPTDKQVWIAYIRECAREALGFSGRTIAEIQAKAVAARPDLYHSECGEFIGLEELVREGAAKAVINGSRVGTAPPARKLRGAT